MATPVVKESFRERQIHELEVIKVRQIAIKQYYFKMFIGKYQIVGNFR